MQKTNYGKKITGTTIFTLLLAATLFTAVAFAQAAASDKGQTSGNGKKLGHIYGVGNNGTPPSQNP